MSTQCVSYCTCWQEAVINNGFGFSHIYLKTILLFKEFIAAAIIPPLHTSLKMILISVLLLEIRDMTQPSVVLLGEGQALLKKKKNTWQVIG